MYDLKVIMAELIDAKKIHHEYKELAVKINPDLLGEIADPFNLIVK